MSARKLELLSPAKNVEIGIAAITAGADAVYIGGPSFGARSAAGNSIEEIATLCSFAHRFGAHVYMTVNTLLYDNELEGVERMIGEARNAGVDGIIVQDPAVLSMSTVKDLELHCSTQMNIDTVEKARFAQELGFSQIVVPREFSLDEIKAFTSALPDMRFEVFVSGAMCVSVSGVCFISELMTDRSANRGSCAQICRLPMDLYHHDRKAAKENPELKDELLASGHLLSMKDNLRLHELEDLVEAGASSFKIEGRLKDRDFVVNQVAAFRERLDKIIDNSNGRYERASIGVSKRTFVPDLTKTFNRGFTSALVHGDNSDMINTQTPKSLGELMGEVIYCGSAAPVSSNRNRFSDKSSSRGGKFGGDKFAKGRGPSSADKSQSFVVDMKLSCNCVLNNGDSYTFFDDKGELAGFRVNRASMLSAAPNSGSKTAKSQWVAQQAKSHKGAAGHTLDAGKSTFAFGKNADGAVVGQIAAIKLADGSIEGKAGDTVRLHVQAVPEGMSVGAKLHRNVDTLFIKSINMPKSILRKTPLSCVVDIAQDTLSISFMDEYDRCGSASVTYAQVHEELTQANPDFDISALQPLKQEVMSSKLIKLGDDYLSLQESDITINGNEENAVLPLSAFNNLRREALQDYVRVVQLPRCKCIESNLTYLDGKSESLVYTDPQGLQSGTKANATLAAADGNADAAVAVADSNTVAAQIFFPEGSIDPRLISNAKSRAFYEQYMKDGLEPPNRLIGNAVMTCRNCLIKNHALCHDLGGSTTGFYLMIGKHRFDLVTNCKRCLMYLVPHEEA